MPHTPQKSPEKPDPGVLEAQKQAETTLLSPIEEQLFKSWTKANGIEDVDAPESSYDYRGFFKTTNGAVHPPGSVEHFPDTFKQHGHPTFSIESIYSKGAHDGGMWQGENYIPEMKPEVSHDDRSDTEKDPIRTMIDLMKERNKSQSEMNKGRSIEAKQREATQPKSAPPVAKIDPTKAKIDIMKETNKAEQLKVKDYELKHPKPVKPAVKDK